MDQEKKEQTLEQEPEELQEEIQKEEEPAAGEPAPEGEEKTEEKPLEEESVEEVEAAEKPENEELHQPSREETEEEEPEKETSASAVAPAVVTDKNQLAQQKVAAAREQVLSAEEEVEECLRNIEGDIERFENYEKEELLPVVLTSRHLLEEIGVEELPEGSDLLPELELVNPEEEKIRIEDLSSGKAGAFFLSLFGGIVALLIWYLFAVKKAGAELIPQKLPDLSSLSELAKAIANAFGQGENPAVGAAIVVGTTLVVMWLIYIVLVAVRTSRNVRQAQEVEEAAGFYCRKKEECKEKMKEVREHLENLEKTVRKYEVILAELNATLNRALHVEGVQNFDELHTKTKKTARELQVLLKELDTLLATPMAQSGVLTPESIDALRRAKRAVNDHILHLYS